LNERRLRLRDGIVTIAWRSGLNLFSDGMRTDRDGSFAVDKKAHCESKGESFSIELPIAGGSACFSYGFE
jgi:hypothetical protein